MSPRTKRDTLKRKVNQAAASLERAAAYLLELRSVYDPEYPEYVEHLDNLLQGLVLLLDAVKAFRAIV